MIELSQRHRRVLHAVVWLLGVFAVWPPVLAAEFSCVIPPAHEAKPLPAGVNPENRYARLGYLDVTLYGADPTGVSDSTDEIQAAINDAYAHKMATFFPSGTYLISDTLHMVRCQDANTQWRERLGHQLVGSTNGPRPKLKLANSALGFDDPSIAESFAEDGIFTSTKPVIFAWSPGCWTRSGAPGPCNLANTQPILDPEFQRGAQNYNQVIRGIDIDLGRGNPGATGIRMRGAEGSAIQDVRITAHGAFAGLYSLPGSGGSVTNVEIVGGRFGVFASFDSQTGPMPVLTGARLFDQTERAIWYNGVTPMTVVGFQIRKQRGPVIEVSQVDEESSAGHLSLVDGRVRIVERSGPVVQNTDRNLYLTNVYTLGAQPLVTNVFGGGSTVTVERPYLWTRIDEYAFSPDIYPDFTQLINGRKRDGVLRSLANPASKPPDDLVSRHTWPRDYWSFEGNKALVVDDFGAVGDGVADDTRAIQRAINAAAQRGIDNVLVPRGHYRVSDTIQLRWHTRLFGIASDKSRLEPTGWRAAVNTPIIRSAPGRWSSSSLGDLKLELYGTTYRIYAIDWQSGRRSIVKNVWPLWDIDDTRSTNTLQRTVISGNGGGRWYNLHNENRIDTSEDAHRAVLVNRTTEPLRFYMLSNQHVAGEAISEIRSAANVTIFGLKTETHGLRPEQSASDWPRSLIIGNSCNISIHGYSGLGEQSPGRALMTIINSTNVLVSSMARWGSSAYPPDLWYHLAVIDGGLGRRIRADTPVNVARIGPPERWRQPCS